MPKRDQTPPYEIMRGRSIPPASTTPASSEESPADPGTTPSDPPVPSRAPWWVGSSAPLVLRVPRGLAVLGVVGLLLLIVLAYWVGTQRGEAAATPDPEQPALGTQQGPSGYYIGAEDYDGPVEEVPEMIVEDDRRVEGRWYIRLMESTEDDCRKVAQFFADRGVAIQLLERNNGRFRVYVIGRSYPTAERYSEAAQYYLQLMRQHGREWKISNGGRGDDLASMDYFQCVR